VLPARRAPVAPDPVVFLSGGPGLGAAEEADFASWALDSARVHRDVVLIDQRGTGESNPLDCHLYDDGSLQAYVTPIFPLPAVRACQASLSRHTDLTRYTTADASDDLAEVLTALGYSSANLLGGSYGTKAALVFARRHPDRVRRLVLFGVYPPDKVAALAGARAGAEPLSAAIAAHSADGTDPRADLDSVMARLRRQPVTVRLWNWRRIRHENVVLTARGFAERAFSMFYVPSRGRRLFPLLHVATMGDWVPLTKMLIWQGRMQRAGRSTGMMLTILCTEDASRAAAADTARLAAASPLGLPVVAELVAACAEWPHRPVEPADTLPVDSPAPTLLISGALDPITPPDWADSAASHLPHSVRLVGPTSGHAMLNDNERAAIGAFLDGPD
jgi:pimeloyl-ACP methyl ester carboxylesterase